MKIRFLCFLWITGVVAPAMLGAFLAAGFSGTESATAAGLVAAAAAEVAIRLLGTPGSSGRGGSGAPATAVPA
ncbi:hypothetical protein KCV87_14120 [Actinosynnema pretiosum subsp. pretiosum]|uniref:Uncharacterized protein n=2 Tax=Actinosynnema TaxID=40566 RepID=C6WRG4_ACTMD|nr:hypothetical protein [Actinosynnema mirum]ACU35216.1 hypothetical protein Amir_1264 [Actinosynnema mirum DSM 43827]AXX28597.1 hypothetical protein APASM_1232 [Actinosynnema pretiosum subsp. pretiosum]QUF07071.1 hypothetical protein KCV87_14120 [Actinosynnema pretiosum subsp. pretiosum]